MASATLAAIESSGWEAVFGKVEDDGDGGDKKAALHAAAIQVHESRGGTRPWCFGG